ncbi:MAG: TonB-dependent receptor [Sphingomonadales bacterium]|nr:TonB-dependent receptor [Sphingomonadales bacterium]
MSGVAVIGLAAPGSARAQGTAQPAARYAAMEAAPPAPDAPVPPAGNAIIVTAPQREQTLQDTPVAVTVTTAEMIERAQIRDIRDLSTVVPSLRVNQLQSSANTNFYIRGFGNGANNAGIEPSVGLFVDGVYRSRSASMISDLPDVQRIEVLRGPQSTLFGKNASAGVISLITREPKFAFGGNVEASYGNYNAVVLKGVVTGPLSDTVAASLAGGYNRRDGYATDLGTGNREYGRDRWFVRGQVLAEPSSDFKVRLIGDYGRIDEVCCAAINLQRSPAPGASQIITGLLGGQISDPANPFGGVVYNNFDSTNKIDNWGLSAQLDYRIGLLKLTSITAYRKTKAVTNQDSDFTSADLLGRNFQDLGIDTFTQELRASTDWDGPVNALLGAFYFNEKVNQQNQVLLGTQLRPYADALIQGLSGQFGTPFTLTQVEGILGAAATGDPAAYLGRSFAPGSGFDENYHLADDSFSIFGQIDFKVASRLTLTGGVNYTHDAKTFSTSSQSNEFFSAIPLSDPVLQANVVNVLVAQTLGTSDPSQIAMFAQANPQQYAAIVSGAAATADKLQALKPLQFLPPFVNVPNAIESGKVSDGHWSFTARLAYDLNDTVNLYASYATGYKAASVNLSRDSRPTQASIDAGLSAPNLSAGSRFAGPEDSTVWEAGIKGDWTVATANFAVFKQTIKGFQSNIFTGLGFFLANAGKQSSFGFEFEGTVKPTSELTFSLGMTYLEPKYDDFVLSGVGDLTGTRPGGVTPLSATLGAQWDHELGNGDRVILHGDFHYEAPFALVEGLPGLVVKNPLTGLPATGTAADFAGAIAAATSRKQEINLLNGSLTYAMQSGLELTVWGRNILDRRTILQVFDSPVQVGSISGYPSEPRTYGVSARLRF